MHEVDRPRVEDEPGREITKGKHKGDKVDFRPDQSASAARDAKSSRFNAMATSYSAAHPTFEVGRVYSRRADIHNPYGGQQQGGICTPSRVPCLFLFTGPSVSVR